MNIPILSNYEITKVLYQVKRLNENIFKSFWSKGLTISVSAHDTAVHVRVYLELEGQENLMVWYHTSWLSSCYQFNEQGKVDGIQSDCEFAFPLLEDVINKCIEYLDFEEKRFEQEKNKEKVLDNYKYQTKLEKYRQAFGDKI